MWKKCLEGRDILQNVESIIHKVESAICLLKKLPQCGKYVDKLPQCGKFAKKTSTMWKEYQQNFHDMQHVITKCGGTIAGPFSSSEAGCRRHYSCNQTGLVYGGRPHVP